MRQPGGVDLSPDIQVGVKAPIASYGVNVLQPQYCRLIACVGWSPDAVQRRLTPTRCALRLTIWLAPYYLARPAWRS